MDQRINFTPDYAASLIGWWAMAGVEYDVAHNTVNWLAPEVSNEPRIEPRTEPSTPRASVQTQNNDSQPSPHRQDNMTSWPQSLEALKIALDENKALPGNGYGGKTALPVGSERARLMIICDLPDADEVMAGKLSHGASGRLLENIIKAAGYDLAQCYITALATTRPGIGELPEGAAPQLTPFMHHQIGLVQPERVLLLGTAACRALLNADMMSSRGRLENINYNAKELPAIATFHPRTLLAQPMLKAQVWKDLRMLIKKGTL
jgi:uracil-DNA glycosylase